MKKIIIALFLGLFIVSGFNIQVNKADAYVSVKGYYKKNGTYVAPYVRSNPNGLKYDNYGYKPSQGLYNSSYGTKGSTWDTPTYITDPDYYVGKSLYNSGSTSSSSSYTYPTSPTYYSTTSCPINSYLSGSSCYCSYGYKLSTDKSSCLIAPVKTATELCQDSYGVNAYSSMVGKCSCSIGYEWSTSVEKSCIKSLTCGVNEIKSGNKCITPDEACQNSFGLNSKSINQLVDSSNNTSCICKDNYEWDSIDKKSCVFKVIIEDPNKIIFTKNLKLGSVGDDVRKLQTKLSVSATGYFGLKTFSAVKAFQTVNELEVNGIVDSKFIELING